MNRPLVLVTEPISAEPRNWIGDRCEVREGNLEDDSIHKDLAKVQGLVVRTYTTVDSALLELMPSLKVVGRAGVGLDNIDLDACAARGIRVVHTPRANAMSVVEYTISMMMRSLRTIQSIDRVLDEAHWHQARESAISDSSVVDSTLGIVGFGYIGSRVGRAAEALGMRVVYHDLLEHNLLEMQGSDAEARSFEETLRESRCVTIHVDGRGENRGLINEHAFGMMRDDVVLINASRGFVINPVAAARFAMEHPSARLIFDVHDPEPIRAVGPDWPSGLPSLMDLENVVLTPHIAAATREAKTAMSWVVRDVWAVLEGRDPEHARV
ncbi:MAG: NAD(P)-dependent oxidoreductase [Phycisphaerales bacterium]